MTTMTRSNESTAAVLLVAFELSERTWKVGFATSEAPQPRIRQIPAGALEALLTEVTKAQRRLGLPAAAPVVSCYEAGREAFWLHRWAAAQGWTNCVVESSSIEVPRRARRAKTDRLDLVSLLRLLARWARGDAGVWRVVRVPSEAEEDARHLHRMRETLQQERTRLSNRLKGLLTTHGVTVPVRAEFLTRVRAARRWDGTPLPAGLLARVQQVWTQLEALTQQVAAIDATREATAVDPATETGQWVARLQTLRGIGSIGAWSLATEIFGWREIRNGRQLGAFVGLVPVPYQSGDTAHAGGITRAGNRHVRRLVVQLAWTWLRYQPTSALSRWYRARFDRGRRLRRIGIIALARKLLIAWWRYGARGDMPAGAIVKA
jgi:transposase